MSTLYYVQISRRAFGPFSPEALKEMITQGRIDKTTFLSLDKQTWKEAGNFQELFSNVSDVKEKDRQTQTYPLSQTSQHFPKATIDADKWFVSVDGRECSGSFTTRELFDLLRSNKISLDSLVWRQGDKVSFKLGENQEIRQEIESFNQTAPDPFGAECQRIDVPQKTEVKKSQPTVAVQDVKLASKRTPERLASKIKTLFISAWICIGVMATTTIVAGVLYYKGLLSVNFTDFILGSFVCWLAVLALTGSVVFTASFLHAFWSAIPKETARANPDEAVAFLFVPGFGIYWIFQALYGGAIDANEALRQYGYSETDEKDALLVSPGWALATSLFFDLGASFNPVSGLFFLLCLGVTTVQMKNAALKLVSLNAARA